jgi:large subunit ribosomal protein L21
MYAIIRTGGRQFRAEVGQTIDVERLPHNVGDSFTITDVLLIGDGDKTIIGQPNVDGAAVNVTVKEQFRGDKVIVFKYRQRTNYRRMRGHRHYHTRIHVDGITVG